MFSLPKLFDFRNSVTAMLSVMLVILCRWNNTYAIMWPKYICFIQLLSEPAEYFHMHFCSRVYCLQIPILQHPVVTGEIHSYLQNSNSTFFLIYAYDYTQHTTSPSFTYSILIKTQPKKPTFQFPSTCLPSSQINDEHRHAIPHNTMVLRNLHFLAKIKARLMVIQLTELPWHCEQ